MEIDEGREYLGSYKILGTKIARLKEMLGMNPENSAKYKKEITECRVKRDKIESEIDAVDGGILSEILALRYICGKTLEEIALTVGYCKRQTERLHIKALDKFAIA